MPRLIIASHNPNKIKEIEAIIGPIAPELKAVSIADLADVPPVVEDGQTFTSNAEKKATAIARLYPDDFVLADDSGLSVQALNGEPGVYSARYAGDHDDAANVKKVLAKMAGVPTKDRGANFTTVIVLVGPGRQSLVTQGVVAGEITTAPVGDQGFGYDPIFYVPAYGKTFAQLTASQKNQVSHRGLALQQLAQELPDWLKGGE
ncbi:XTP/dITP diphosphatase [Leuconostocaceae bacterium ESL0723]|nr:XTP/dITP diphosphatase [Leuconostocaceae bacterium ESL0723]